MYSKPKIKLDSKAKISVNIENKNKKTESKKEETGNLIQNKTNLEKQEEGNFPNIKITKIPEKGENKNKSQRRSEKIINDIQKPNQEKSTENGKEIVRNEESDRIKNSNFEKSQDEKKNNKSNLTGSVISENSPGKNNDNSTFSNPLNDAKNNQMNNEEPTNLQLLRTNEKSQNSTNSKSKKQSLFFLISQSKSTRPKMRNPQRKQTTHKA